MKKTLFLDQIGCQWHTVPIIIQTNVTLKIQRYPQNSMFTATEGPTGMPLVVLG